VVTLLSPSRKRNLVELTQNLIRHPSPSGKEADIAGFLRSAMESLQFDEDRVDRYGNVTGRFLFGPGGPRLLFESHLDHVAVENGSAWTFYPFGGVLHRNRIYGRGATDNKGALAAMVLAAAFLGQDRREGLSGELLVSGTVNQEVFEGVASELIHETYHPDRVIIGEASELCLMHGQTGRTELTLSVEGKRVHSSRPHEGINAVWKTVSLLDRIRREFVPPADSLGEGVLEVTEIISSPFPRMNVVPDLCRVTFDRRLVVGERPKDVLQGLQSILERAGRDDPELHTCLELTENRFRCYTGYLLKTTNFAPAWLMPQDADFCSDVSDALHRVGLKPERGTYSSCSNGSFYAGRAGIPTLGFGPSTEGLNHAIDEYIELEQLYKAMEGYYSIAETLLGGAS
jgi:putative selenium metabolism hydrolase